VFSVHILLSFSPTGNVLSQETANHSIEVQLDQEFLDDVMEGLRHANKRLSCKYFYDERGSKLFDQICELDEYYLTRTEQAIMDQHAREMACQLGEGVMLVEFGSGSSTKTQVLLENLIDPAAYVPLDISEEHLLETAKLLRRTFPEIEILPLVADFTLPFQLPMPTKKASHAAIYFPGSTIGNFEPEAAQNLLAEICDLLGDEGGVLIGIDLQKDPAIIHSAYNDSSGVTAEFNLNLLHRINRELDGNFDVDQFQHLADYDEKVGRVEIYLVSQCDQTVEINGQLFEFKAGERIFTEHSHKYTIESFEELANQAGFSLHKYWTDPDDLFAVLHLVHETK
jgi:dimethylhistidine N-methyltransferase